MDDTKPPAETKPHISVFSDETPEVSIPHKYNVAEKLGMRLNKFVTPLVLVLLLASIVGVRMQWGNSFSQRSRASGSDVIVSLQPSSKTVNVGETFQLDIYVQSATQKVTGIDLTVSYDADALGMKSFTVAPSPNFLAATANGTPDLLKPPQVNVTGATGRASVALTVGAQKDGRTGTGRIVSLIFLTKNKPGMTAVKIDNATVVSATGSQNNVIATPLKTAAIVIGTRPSPTSAPPKSTGMPQLSPAVRQTPTPAPAKPTAVPTTIPFVTKPTVIKPTITPTPAIPLIKPRTTPFFDGGIDVAQ